ncbi:MAG: hypothetical protein A4E28_00643 [Methanocella sp. PtaU1.Bin125]|nr:MAG: hypothetical protein A4E28_00643 [Methanocella sp. PtaU1.Bin125]
MSGTDIPGAPGFQNIPGGASPASAPIELIDVVFALSNIRLVREIVQDNLRQLDELNVMGKGQTEGLKAMIVQKQQQALRDLDGVEGVLNGIVEASLKPERTGAQQDISLGPEHSKALIYAITFAISHLMKFMPQPGTAGPEIPGSIV